MKINEIPFVLELTEQQRELLLKFILAMPISGNIAEVAQVVQEIQPIIEQLRNGQG